MDKFVFLFVIVSSGASSTINTEDSNRISNAFPAHENQFPYAISLQQINQIQSYTRGHRCGGALITDQHALTAASCTFNDINGVFEAINPAEYRMFAGSVALTNDGSANSVRSIANITVSPLFSTSQPFVNDIAIITLKSPFSNNVVPVKLSLPILDAMPVESQVCTVVGWGSQNTSATASTQLMYLHKSVFDQTSCSALYSNLQQVNILNSMICASSGLMMPSGCTGDLGNPLVCNELLTGLLTISNSCTASVNPEVYTRVSSYYNWIENVIKNPVSEPSPEPAPGGASVFQPRIAMSAIISLMLYLVLPLKP